MADRRHSVEVEEEHAAALVEAEVAMPPDKAAFHQEHTVVQGSFVTLHGGLFTVKDGVYNWHMTNPKKEEVPLIDPKTAEPSFIARDVGDYVARVTTMEGRAEFIIHVTE